VKGTKTFRISHAWQGLAVTLAFLSASMTCGIGAQSSSTAPPTLKAELQPLASFVGEWNCEGEFVASKTPIAAHIAIAPDLDGTWLTFRWDDKAPNRFHAFEVWGFDKTAKHFTNFIYDNFGGARLFQSSGWEGDTLTWTGNALASPPAANERFTIERKSPKEFVISYDTRKPQAEWATGDRLACNRVEFSK
jgi:hypothetical protein